MTTAAVIGNCDDALCLALVFSQMGTPHLLVDQRINGQPYYNILTTKNETINSFKFKTSQPVDEQLPGAGAIIESLGFATTGMFQQRYFPGLIQDGQSNLSSLIPAVYDKTAAKFVVLDQPHTYKSEFHNKYNRIFSHAAAVRNDRHRAPEKRLNRIRPGRFSLSLPSSVHAPQPATLRFPITMNSDGSGVQRVLGFEYDLDKDTYRVGIWIAQSDGDFTFHCVQIDESDQLLVDAIKRAFFPMSLPTHSA